MDKGLNELDKEELFMWLSPKVDDDVAHAVLDNELSGAGLLDLNDDELKEVVPKLGPRKALKKLIDDFKGVSAAQQKVRHNYFKIYTSANTTSLHIKSFTYCCIQICAVSIIGNLTICSAEVSYTVIV